MKPSLDSDDDEELGIYQKRLRERANRSIQQLTTIFADRSSNAEDVAPDMSQDLSNTDGENSWHQVPQSEAANQLRSLLQKKSRESSLSPAKRKLMPKRHPDEGNDRESGPKDLTPVLQNQTEYIKHLEAEVKFCKEELIEMKQRVRVVVVENEKLQEERKSKMAEETLRDYTLLDSTLNAANSPAASPSSKPRTSVPREAEDHKWKRELEQLKCLYQAQTESLEAQVMSVRKDLLTSQMESEEVKERLRRKEALAAATAGSKQLVGGLCLKCAQHEAVLAETHANVHAQAMERLTRERDELMSILCALRASQAEAQQREWGTYQQVKQAVEMAEEANLEKAKALVQCERIQGELVRHREALERELATEQARLTQAMEAGRSQAHKEKEELAQMVTVLSQRVAELEGLLDRSEREKNSLNTQLEENFRKLTSQEAENNKVCGDLRYQCSQAQLRREEAERELRDSVSKLQRQLSLAEQEVQKLGLGLGGCRQRLEEAQRAEGRARTEAASLAQELNHTQRHCTHQEEEAAARCHGEDMAALTFQAQQRELHLTQTLQQMEAQHGHTVSDMDALITSQNALIGKLKEECVALGEKLADLTERSRMEVEHLSLEKQHLHESMEKFKGRCLEMEEQCVQHGRMHQRMKNRLQQLDQHCQSSAQQVMELLSKQTQLMQERQALTEELRNLRAQIPAVGRPDAASL